MSTRSRLSLAALAALAAVTALPGTGQAEYAGNTEPTTVPTTPPPICGSGNALPYVCNGGTRSDLYFAASCPNQTAKDIVLCVDPPTAPLVGMECLSFDGDFECHAAPQSPDGTLTYTWSGTALLTVYQAEGNRSPLVYVGCRRLTGGGWLTLTVTTAENVSSTISEYLSCLQ